MPPLLEVEELEVVYRSRFSRGGHRALRGIDMTVDRGETLGIVGESGCGKSTLAKAIMRLLEPTGGCVRFDGQDLRQIAPREMRRLRRHMQMVFQDPIDSLNPRRTVADTIADSLKLVGVGGTEAAERIDTVLTRMGLDPALSSRRPHELSGGQAQRVGLARALVLDPEFVVFDEPTSALDVSVQSQLLEVIRDLTQESTRAYVYISHDLGTVRGICSRVAVMYLGLVVEEAPVQELFDNPLHPYTRALLSSVHSLHGACTQRPLALKRDLDEADMAEGCSLIPRCPFAVDGCAIEPERLIDFGGGHRASCRRIPELEE